MNLSFPSGAHRADAFSMEKGVLTFPQLLFTPHLGSSFSQHHLEILCTPPLHHILRGVLPEAIHDLGLRDLPSPPLTVKTT